MILINRIQNYTYNKYCIHILKSVPFLYYSHSASVLLTLTHSGITIHKHPTLQQTLTPTTNMGTAAAPERPTVRVTNIPCTITAKELLSFLESTLGADSIFAVEIASDHTNWKSRGYGRVQFTSLAHKRRAQSLSSTTDLVLLSHNLRLFECHDDIIARPLDPKHRLNDTSLYAGFAVNEETMSVLELWEGVRAWVMPERKRVEFWVWKGGDCYKMEIAFENIVESVGCSLGGDKVNAILLKVNFSSLIFYCFSFMLKFTVVGRLLLGLELAYVEC